MRISLIIDQSDQFEPISVKDHLPSPGEVVFAIDMDNQVGFFTTFTTDPPYGDPGHFVDGDSCYCEDITHWIPLSVSAFCELVRMRGKMDQEIADLSRERDDLLEERDTLKDMVEGNVRETLLSEMHFQDGALQMYVEHPIFGLFAASIAEMFIDMGAKNYIEISMSCEKVGPVTVTCQKQFGKTPHRLRLNAEAERDALIHILQAYQPAGSPPPGNADVLAGWILETITTERDSLRGYVAELEAKALEVITASRDGDASTKVTKMMQLGSLIQRARKSRKETVS